jgi:hypothetical protein
MISFQHSIAANFNRMAEYPHVIIESIRVQVTLKSIEVWLSPGFNFDIRRIFPMNASLILLSSCKNTFHP